MRRIDADELAADMVLYDEYSNETFVVTDVSMGKHSVSVHGRKVSVLAGHVSLTDHASLYIKGDSGLFLLDD